LAGLGHGWAANAECELNNQKHGFRTS